MSTTTLLDVVQTILSDANGDDANSITDTVEATQCAHVVQSVYDDIVAEYDLLAVKQLFQLDGLGDTTKPTHMRVPEEFHSIEWIKYDHRTSVSDPQGFREITYLPPRDFLELTDARRSNEPNVYAATDPSGVKIYVRTDQMPLYYTLFDDRTVVFDSFNSDVESTLYQTKTQAYGQKSSRLVLADATVIQLPMELMALLINEARSMYFDIHAGGSTQKVERRASRSRVRAQRIRHTMRNNAEQFEAHTGPNYGRRRR
jgi:hypothetical protein